MTNEETSEVKKRETIRHLVRMIEKEILSSGTWRIGIDVGEDTRIFTITVSDLVEGDDNDEGILPEYRRPLHIEE